MNILFLDDHKLICDAVAQIIEKEPFCDSIKCVETVKDGITALSEQSFDVVVTDIDLKGEKGQELLVFIRDNHPEMKRMCMSMRDDFETITEVLALGVTGYVTKDSGFDELSLGIQSVFDGKIFFGQNILSLIVENLISGSRKKISSSSDSLGILTNRERQIFMMLIEGAALHSIGDRLYISPKTVENHRANIYKKLEVSDRVSLINYAKNRGLKE